MRIEASGYKVEFPQQCACCGCNSDTALTVSASKSSGQKVVRTKTNTWDFPYCRRCVKHTRIASIARIVAVTTAAAALIAAGIFYLRVRPWLGVLIGAAMHAGVRGDPLGQPRVLDALAVVGLVGLGILKPHHEIL